MGRHSHTRLRKTRLPWWLKRWRARWIAVAAAVMCTALGIGLLMVGVAQSNGSLTLAHNEACSALAPDDIQTVMGEAYRRDESYAETSQANDGSRIVRTDRCRYVAKACSLCVVTVRVTDHGRNIDSEWQSILKSAQYRDKSAKGKPADADVPDTLRHNNGENEVVVTLQVGDKVLKIELFINDSDRRKDFHKRAEKLGKIARARV